MKPKIECSNEDLPLIHFLWIGPMIKDKSDTGPKLLANATNSNGEKYPICYWVEEENLETARIIFQNTNITIESIETIIGNFSYTFYSNTPESKEKIKNLLRLCKEENLPTVAKEILTPMLMACYPGYYFDTSIGILEADREHVELPYLPFPALPRNLELVDPDNPTKYKVKKRNVELVDLYVYYSVGPMGKKIFSELANDTIQNWDLFFNGPFSIEYSEPFKKYKSEEGKELIQLNYMINKVLLKAVFTLYMKYRSNADDLIEYKITRGDKLIPKKNNKHKISSQIMTIDGLSGFELNRPLFIKGKYTQIFKKFSDSWRDNFKSYLEKRRVLVNTLSDIEKIFPDNLALLKRITEISNESSITLIEKLTRIKNQLKVLTQDSHQSSFFHAKSSLSILKEIIEKIESILPTQEPSSSLLPHK